MHFRVTLVYIYSPDIKLENQLSSATSPEAIIHRTKVARSVFLCFYVGWGVFSLYVVGAAIWLI